jgi:hypothetical protein
MSILKQYHDLRNQWVPVDANVIHEDRPDDGCGLVVFASEGTLNVMRFFTLGNTWTVSHDYRECADDIPELLT